MIATKQDIKINKYIWRKKISLITGESRKG